MRQMSIALIKIVFWLLCVIVVYLVVAVYLVIGHVPFKIIKSLWFRIGLFYYKYKRRFKYGKAKRNND